MKFEFKTNGLFANALKAAQRISPDYGEARIEFKDAETWRVFVVGHVSFDAWQSCLSAVEPIVFFPKASQLDKIDGIIQGATGGTFYLEIADDAKSVRIHNSFAETTLEVEQFAEVENEKAVLTKRYATPVLSFAVHEIAPFIVKQDGAPPLLYLDDRANPAPALDFPCGTEAFAIAIDRRAVNVAKFLNAFSETAFVRVDGRDTAAITFPGKGCSATIIANADATVFPSVAPKYVVDVMISRKGLWNLATFRFNNDFPECQISRLAKHFKAPAEISYIARDLNGRLLAEYPR